MGRQQFQPLDTNRDGAITFKKYLAPMQEKRKGRRAK
jgi:hypothetical protein